MLKRGFDILLALVLGAILILPMLFIAALVRLSSRGSALYWSDRVGRDNRLFRMPKFRSMRTGAPVVATHLLQHASVHVTPLGRVLRKTSLDELPQLWSVLRGDMSFVGPRPALFNQHDLIALRTEHGVERLRPGITGWAQINGRDELPIPEKVRFDAEYLERACFVFDLRILWLTFWRVLQRHGVQH
jgi:O-antigen biosynthesis protein WbqP